MLEEKNFDMRCGTCGRETDGWCERCDGERSCLFELINIPEVCCRCGAPELEVDRTADGEEYDKCLRCGTVQD